MKDEGRIVDPLARRAVAAIDAGDVAALEALMSAHPQLVRERFDGGEGYFRRPYLLWFVAENPIRNGRLPENILEVTRAILRAARRQESFQEQIDYALGLVCTGCVARECGVQLSLIDVLVDAGASPGTPDSALSHREHEAVEHLLERGAELTLATAVCTGRAEAAALLAKSASAAERQVALQAAAVCGKAEALAMLIDGGVDLSAFGPEGFHSHSTALHQAVNSGSLDAVRTLVEAGADRVIRDRMFDGTPLGWAEHLGRTEIAAYLRGLGRVDRE